MSVTTCISEKTTLIDGQYTLFSDGAAGGVIVYSGSDSNKNLPTLLPERLTPEELYNKHQGLINNTIFRLSEMCRGYDYDDLEQEGRIALWTAAEQFDPYYGTQFSSYAITIIRRTIMHYVKNPTSKLFGGRRLDVVSIQEMQERVEGTSGSSVELFPAPDELTPAYLSESDEIMSMLTKAAEEISLVKESKGIRALIMQLQGVDSSTIAKRMGIAPKSYSALVTAGRRALKNNPTLLRYISLIKNQPVESTTAYLLGSEYTVRFSDTATFDTTKFTVSEHLAIFSELLSGDEVAECLMDHVRYGSNAVIVDEDTWTTTRFAFDINEVLLLNVSNIRSKSTIVSRKAEPA
jgi:RNA polymerase sigma factor (sigma-70 family)